MVLPEKPRICVLTLAIGADYRKNLAKALKSKRDYCAKHGYTYVELHDEVWNHDRPIAWSKVPVWIEYSKKSALYDYIWISDADVWITNPELRLEDHVLPLLPDDKDLLMTYDSCQNINSGNMIMKPTKWCTEFFTKVWNSTEFIYHRLWENGQMIRLMATESEDCQKHIECTMKAWVFNAYLKGYQGTRLWQPGDFLVHFAGIDHSERMKELMERMERGEVPRLSIF